MDDRFKVKSPNSQVHERVRAIVKQADKLVLDNPRRLSLSVKNPPADLIQRLEQEGARIEKDVQYDLD
ncbi:hypothetical protein [Pseudorhodoplanes sp.]|uniref:hypothetical protein n=1 Tax=Pseudorhodoplanes sp. TaxID=1934341 RepID=UPI002CC7B1BB|nr:hypothetical protein [Pseudorhodoplanes sp.]HWV53366.1 hypothetical protein [Pseudorhodoplanes sp.]